MQSPWLFVAGLSDTMSMEQLQTVVARHARVRACYRLRDPIGRRLKCAYVELEQADGACVMLNAEALAGRYTFRVMVTDPPSWGTGITEEFEDRSWRRDSDQVESAMPSQDGSA